MALIQEWYWETVPLAQIHQDQGIPPRKPSPLEEPREEVRLLGTHLFTCFLPTPAFILSYSFNSYYFNVN